MTKGVDATGAQYGCKINERLFGHECLQARQTAL